MTRARGVVGPVAAGAGFGALTSLVNAVSSSYTGIGWGGTVWGDAARVVSLVVGAGWAWAAVAVAVGWWVGTARRGAAAGAAALVAASWAYYLADSVLRAEPFAWYGGDVALWSVVGAVAGALLGAVGSVIPRPGLPGFAAALAVPAGAAGQLLLIPSPDTDTPAVVAETVVGGAVAAAAVAATHRFLTGRPSAPVARTHRP